MSATEVNAAIQEDISEDAWQRQQLHPVAFRGRRLAEGLERALFLCPNCGSMGTLRSKGSRLLCKCGFSVTYAEDGSFVPAVPFRTLQEWDVWQHEQLRRRAFPHDKLLFSDRKLRLTRIEAGHRDRPVGHGRLEQYEDRLICAGHIFPLSEVDNMAMVQANLLLLSFHGQYWQIKAEGSINLRKYLAIWKEK